MRFYSAAYLLAALSFSASTVASSVVFELSYVPDSSQIVSYVENGKKRTGNYEDLKSCIEMRTKRVASSHTKYEGTPLKIALRESSFIASTNFIARNTKSEGCPKTTMFKLKRKLIVTAETNDEMNGKQVCEIPKMKYNECLSAIDKFDDPYTPSISDKGRFMIKDTVEGIKRGVRTIKASQQ